MFRQTPPSRMGPTLSWRQAGDRLAPRFGFHFVPRHARLFFGQQLQLQIAQRFTTRPQPFDALLPQFFAERLDFQMRPGEFAFAFENCDAELEIGRSHGGSSILSENARNCWHFPHARWKKCFMLPACAATSSCAAVLGTHPAR